MGMNDYDEYWPGHRLSDEERERADREIAQRSAQADLDRNGEPTTPATPPRG